MIKKNYSLEYISKIYNTDVEKLKIWTTLKFDGITPTELSPSLNNEIATFLGVIPLSLNPNKIKKKLPNINKKEVSINNKNEYKTEINQIENARYKERIKGFVSKLNGKISDIRILNKINQAYESLPIKNQYLKESCEKKYFTWKDIIFTEEGLKIDPNIIYLSIKIDGPTNILNDLKASYFQKKYEKDLYKVYINKFDKKSEYELSNDIDKIKNIVNKHINNYSDNINKLDFSKEKKNNTNRNFNLSKQIGLKEISEIFHDNKYIQAASKLLDKNSKAIALWENNNSILEESILIILKHKIFTFVIWENINDNRACYIFRYKAQNFDEKIKNLIKFINSDIDYKRWDLFNNKGRSNSLNYEEYHTMIHENTESYKQKLNHYLSPYFFIT